jgi:hypothetical protein
MERHIVRLLTIAILVTLSASAGALGRDETPGHGPPSVLGARATPCPKPGDPIHIESVAVSDNPMRTGESVTGTVLATCNVAAVTAQVGSYRIGVPKVGAGIFKTSVRVPFLLVPGKFTVVVTAIRTDGATVQTQLPIEVRW